MAPTQTQPDTQPASAAGQEQSGHPVIKTAAGIAALSVLPTPPGPVAGALTVTQIAQATTALLTALKRFQNTRGQAFDAELRKEALAEAPTLGDVVDNIISRELGFEQTFRNKQYERLQAELGPALAITDPQQRKAKVKALLDRERRYTKMREEAMRVRTMAAVRHYHLEQASPQGAYWKLGEGVKQHTLDCFPGTVAVGGPMAIGASRREYAGKLIEIVVASGEVLPVTPNHPVLTRKGWKPAKDIEVSDDLFCDSGWNEREDDRKPEHDDQMRSFADLFEALKEATASLAGRNRVGPLDFHGDVPVEQEIDVVGVYGTLGYGERLLLLGQRREHDGFFGRDPSDAVALTPERHVPALLDGARTSAPGRTAALAGGCDVARRSRGRCDREAHGVRLPTPDRHPGFEKLALERGARNASLLGQTLDGFAGLVATDEVVEVREVDFAGHVFNAETDGGWYTANGFVVGNCLAMGEMFWPWSVLHAFQPPVHHGCACHLMGLREAVTKGLMNPEQVPNEMAAIQSATDRLQKAANAMRSGQISEADIGAYIGELREGRWEERFAKGTENAGRFRPKVGGDPGAELMKRLGLGERGKVMHDLLPTLRPLAQEDRGKWAWVKGKQYRVPHSTEWRKQIGGEVFHSPAGTTNVLRDGQLMSPPEVKPEVRAKLFDRLGAAISSARGHLVSRRGMPLRPGDGPEAVLAMDDRGFVPTRVSPHGAGAWKVSYMHSGTGSVVNAVVSKHGDVEHADWDTTPINPIQARRSVVPPRTFAKHAMDAMSWAHELGEHYGATTRITSVQSTNSLEDHAGFHEHTGATWLGRDVEKDIDRAGAARAAGRALSEDEKRGVWSAYWTTAHEVGHGVNPIHPELFRDEDADLEEALTEENAHRLAVARLTAQGQHDVLRWRDENPREIAVRGVYRRQRGALADVLDAAGITDPDERGRVVEQLKFQIDPAERFRVLGALLHKAHPALSIDEGERRARLALRSGSAPRAAAPMSPGTNPFGKFFHKHRGGQTSLFDKGVHQAVPKPKPPPVVLGGTTPEPVVQGPVPSFAHIPLELHGKAWGHGDGALKARAEGQNWIVKQQHGDKNWVASELLANALYRLLGINVPVMGKITTPGEPDFAQIPDSLTDEPPLPETGRLSTGVIIRAANGKVTLIEPRNHYGGYIHTFPKGGLEKGLTPQQNALKELWEETGLHAHITGVVGDFKGDTGMTRYYVGVLTGGEPTPSDETQAIKTVSMKEAAEMLNKQRDREVLLAVAKAGVPKGKFEDQFPPVVPGSAIAFQEPAGKKGEPKTPSAELGAGYMADALLGNWDFVGRYGDNLRWGKDGQPVRINHAAAFEYRANGDQKPFGEVPQEAWTMLTRGQGLGAVALDEDGMREQAEVIAGKLPDAKIDEFVNSAPFTDEAYRARVAAALKARVGWMRRFGDGEEDLPKPAEGAEARGLHADTQREFTIYPEEVQALEGYRGAAGRELDAALQASKEPSEAGKKIAKHLDNVLGDAQTGADTYAYIGVNKAAGPSLVGQTIKQRSFTQAHTEKDAAAGKLRIRVLVPGGARAFHVEGASPGEPDMVLPRGARLKITGLKPAADGTAEADAILLPYERPGPVFTKPWKSSFSGGGGAVVFKPEKAELGARVRNYKSKKLGRFKGMEGDKARVEWDEKPGEVELVKPFDLDHVAEKKPAANPSKLRKGDRVRMGSGVEGVVHSVDGGSVMVNADGKMYPVPHESLTYLPPVKPPAAKYKKLKEAAFAELISMELTEAEEHTGVMVALTPHPSTAKKFAVPDGEDPGQLHVTLAFLGHKDNVDADKLKSTVADWAQRTSPLSGEISGHGVFTAGPKPVTYLSPDLPDLPAARQDLVDSLQKAGLPVSTDHGYTPHITLDYKDRSKDMPDHGGHKLRFAKASVVYGGERSHFKFGGELQEGWEKFDAERVRHPSSGELLDDGDEYVGGHCTDLATAFAQRGLKIKALYSGDPKDGATLEHAVGFDPKTGKAFDAYGTHPSVDHAFEGWHVGPRDRVRTEKPSAVFIGDEGPGEYTGDARLARAHAFIDRHWGVR